jgi:hypothetical protein
MSKQLVFTGTIANDKTGDALRNAFIKINSNFTELYSGLSAASTTGATAPTSPSEGWLWYNTTNSNTYIYISGAWVLTNPAYSLPKATASVLGGVKVGSNLSINSDGVLSAANLGNLSVNNQTINGSVVNGDIRINPNGTGAVNVPKLTVGDFGSVLQTQLQIEAFITNYTLVSIVDSSSGPSDALPIDTYGNINGVVAPWTVFQLTPGSSNIPVSTILIDDILTGAGIVPSTVVSRGTGQYASYIIVNLDLAGLGQIQPLPEASFRLLRPIQKAALDITTAINTDIFLDSQGAGDVIVNTNILPIATNVSSLGSPTRRWKELFLGPGTLYVQDETLGSDIGIGARDGDLYIQNSKGLTVGEFTFRDNVIKIADSTRDIEFGVTQATGTVKFNRPINVRGSTGRKAFEVTRGGLTTIIPPANISTTEAGLSIVGNTTGLQQARNFSNTMLQITGADGLPTRISIDSFGTGTYPIIAGRHAGGTVSAPTATLSDETLFRISTQGWGTTGYVSSIGRINIQATQNFTDDYAGTRVRFQLTPTNSDVIQTVTADINSTGLSFVGNATGGITFNDSTRQTTAWTSTAAVSSSQITGLATVATSGSYSDLSNKPDVITVANAGTGISLNRSGSTLGINATGVQTLVAASGTGQIAVSDSGSKNLTLTLPQGIATTSNVQFNNLTITGTLTATNFNIETAPTSAGKTILLASGATTASNIDQGGILLGPIGQTFSRSFLYDLTGNRWNTDGAGLVTLELSATDINVSGQAHFGTAYNDYDFSNATIQADTNVNSYSQNVIKNHSSGSNASADFVAVNDTGNDSANYIDVGINSSTFSNVDYSIMGANDGYLYINGGNLSIGTQTATKNIVFHTGGTTSNKLRATISDTGLTVVGTVSATTFSGALTGNVTGNVSGNAGTVTNGVVTTGSYSNPSWITALAYSKLSGTPTIPAAQVNSDWNATTGLAQILNKPTIFSGAYADLTGKPSLFSGVYADLTGKPTLFSGAYADLTGKPTLATVAGTGSYTDLTNKPTLFSGAYADLTGKPTLFSGSYTDLTNKPTFVSALTTSDGLSANTAATGSVSITNTDKGSSQAIFKNVVVAGQTTVSATTNTDSLTLVAGTNVSITTSGKNVTINGSSQSVIKTISVLGDGSYTATAPDSSVVFAPSGRMSLNIVGNTISITDNAKSTKKHRCKKRNGTYDTDVDMTLPEDTLELIEGKGMSMITDAVNKTITFSAVKSTRDAGTLSSGTLTLDHLADDVVLVTVTGNITIAHTNMSAGREVRLIVKNVSGTSTRTITTGVANGNMSNGDNTTSVGITRSGMFNYVNMGTTTAELYCQAVVA